MVALPNPSFRAKNSTVVARGGGAKSGGALPNLRNFGPKTANFLKPVRTPVAIFGSLGVCIDVPASRHWLISYSPIHLT